MGETGQPKEQRVWLQKQVDAYEAGAERQPIGCVIWRPVQMPFLRTTSIRNSAATRLSLPLNKSLAYKTEAMKQTVSAYKRIAGYGVAEFATLAGYRMAEVYAQLSRDLMDSGKTG